MKDNLTVFQPVYGTEAQIQNQVFTEGYFYVASDSGKIFIDADNVRKQYGGSGGSGGGGTGSLIWGHGNEEDGTLVKATDDASDGDPVFYIKITALDSDTVPDNETLLINDDGRFFKVTDNSVTADKFITVELIAVSGGGSGGGGISVQDLSLTWSNIDLLGSTYIYGQDAKVIFYPHTDVDETVSIAIEVTDGVTKEKIPNMSVEATRILNDDPFEYNMNKLPANNNIQFKVTIISDSSHYNNQKGLTKTFGPIKVLKMQLEKPSDYTMSIQTLGASLPIMPYFTGLGTTEDPVRVFYSVDNGDAVEGKVLAAGNDQHKQLIDIPVQEHGVHSVDLWLNVAINGVEYNSDKVTYEVPWVDNSNDTPIIWLRNELGTIINYEEAVVEYMVYSAVAAREGSPIEVSLYKGGILLNTEEVAYSASQWLRMDLTSNYSVGNNTFTLTVGGVSKAINFYVTNENARDLSLRYTDQLELQFDSIGRSSKEIKVNRNKWVSKVAAKQSGTTPYEAVLSNFNWHTNGWMNDNDGMGSYLHFANGASMTIPMNTISLNTAAQAWTFEIRFRVKNAKKFATLVTEIPKYMYTIDGVENISGEEKTLDEINELKAQYGLDTNGNERVQIMLDEDGNLMMNERNTTKKIVQTDRYIAFRYLNSNNEGFAIGTQEAYFNTQGATVNVKYKENEIINISFVIDKINGLSIYLNGILSGVSELSAISAITMENIPFTINSEYCDFDLYKFRAYPVALSMPDIIHNYISDIKNISIYDENDLTDINDDTKLSYQKLVDYNRDHPDDPTMPYIVIDMTKTEQGIDLPHYKGAKRKVRIEFTNPVADYLLKTNQITPFKYYTHCPSFTADDVELNVQGTSSQKYPRRNFKAKFKKAKNWNYSLGELADQAVSGSYTLQSGQNLTGNWHVDHETIGSNAFTWKIDYMESSGSYNTGFANLMGSGVYSKHPLEDLHLDGVDASDYRVNVYGFPMLAFHKTGENEYTYIGRYNMNLDKSSNERYGFELKKAQPYLTWQREVPVLDENDEPVLDPNTNEPQTTIENYHPNIKDVAECWELRDNQGVWCSWRYPNAVARSTGFRTRMAGSSESEPRLEVAQHFEARYNVDADAFEYAQNIILNKDNGDADESATIGGNTYSAASTYVYNKLQNLQVLFNWLDSTDTNQSAITNVAFGTPRRMLVSGKLTKQILNENFNYDEYILDPKNYSESEFIDVEDTEAMAANGVSYETVTQNGTQLTYGIFTKDSKEYRRQKFYSEFEKHLDLDYCCIYFVMTELLLCYDSRGKNMMIASWGPKEANGDYIWYPIFYDIDTQLGLNNVGAKLWDYDEDCSENGTFSTKDSVLWTNLYDVFKNRIIATYIRLRNEKINETTIENSYMCKAGTTFDSYAMMGKRPIIAIGLDEYYKYVLPVTQPWKDQTGNMTTANYLYACQGDRILSRELLIENRLLYMDSKWLGGAFTISSGGMAGIMFRSTGNKPSTSSDIYIDGKVWSPSAGAYIADANATYPVPYYDATPEYMVTPYLNFYVTTFVDENTFQTEEAYNEAKYPNGIPTVTSPSVAEGYKSGKVDQQLNYFAGSNYISSLGDLSLKYVNQVDLPNATRLLDIKLGSDAPDYFNAEVLDPFNLYTEVNMDGSVKPGHEKSLLRLINLNHLRNLDKQLDIRSADKLEEFRALDTRIKFAKFASGAPLNTVHLPNTITYLGFNQNTELRKLITSATAPTVAEMVNGVLTYKPHSEYEGLFVDGVTNYNSATMTGPGLITEISFDGDALGYGSYTILKNLVDRKDGTGRGNRLSIRMADINWTPYVQVEYGEPKVIGQTYYYLTDHSTYETYARTDDFWEEDTLNGKIYTYDNTKDETIIQDLDLLDTFYDDYAAAEHDKVINQFTNNIESMNALRSYPTISGEMYVSNANGDAIKESDLTNKYAVCWPNLKIRVANVEKAYIAKYVQRLDNGKDNELDIIRYEKIGTVHPTVTSKVPVKQNYDFIGWTLNSNLAIISTSQVAELVASTNNNNRVFPKEDLSNLTALTFSENNDIYVFYAVFAITAYNFNFRRPNGDLIRSYSVNYGSYMSTPLLWPAYDDSALENDQTYKFLGWTQDPEKCIIRTMRDAKLVDFSKIMSQNTDRDFYASFIAAGIRENIIPASMCTGDTTNRNGIDGYILDVTNFDLIEGKITLPTVANDGKPFTVIPTYSFGATTDNGFAALNRRPTHIYWNGEPQIVSIYNNAFDHNTALIYFEMPNTVQEINQYAFRNCTNLHPVEFSEGLTYLAMGAFQSAFAPNVVCDRLYIPSTVTTIDQYALQIMSNSIQLIQLGNSINGNALVSLDYQWFGIPGNSVTTMDNGRVESIIRYGTDKAGFDSSCTNFGFRGSVSQPTT